MEAYEALPDLVDGMNLDFSLPFHRVAKLLAEGTDASPKGFALSSESCTGLHLEDISSLNVISKLSILHVTKKSRNSICINGDVRNASSGATFRNVVWRKH